MRAGQKIGDDGTEIELNVDIVAARAASGIFLREVGTGTNLTVDVASAVTVNIDNVDRVDFGSGTTAVLASRVIGALEDLTTTSNGPILAITENGTLTINGGSDNIGVTAAGSGTILLEARNVAHTVGADLVLNGTVTSGSGSIWLNAADDILVNASVATGGAGSINLVSANNQDDATATRNDASVLTRQLTLPLATSG